MDAQFDFRGRTLPAAAEILVIFDFQLTDVPFELAQLFVNCRHARGKTSTLHAKSKDENRQPAEWPAIRMRHRTLPSAEPGCRLPLDGTRGPQASPGGRHCAETFEWKPGANERFR